MDRNTRSLSLLVRRIGATPRGRAAVLCLAALAWCAICALAIETQSVRDDSYATLAGGELRSAALTSDGYIVPSYARAPLGNTGTEIVWDALREKNGSVLAATGHHGRLVRVSDNKTSKTIAQLPEAELTALLRLKDGSVLVAGAPSGRIYRLADNDKISSYCQVKASFIWRMAQDDSGAVWVATGVQGKLFRLTERSGKVSAEEVYGFQSTNLLDLWIDQQGQFGAKGMVYVAAQNPGWLYRLDPAKKKAEVVYNAQAEEVRAILPMKKGLVLALNSERAPTPAALQLTLRMAGGTVVPAGGAGRGGRGAGPAGGGAEGPGADAAQARSLNEALAPSRGGPQGPPRSTLVLLDPSGYARPFWNSSERPISSIAESPTGDVLAAAGENGRLFEVKNDGKFSMIADLRDDYVVRIVADDVGYLLTSARNGAVYAMQRQRVKEAVYVSRPIDAGSPARWGKYYFSGLIDKGQSVDVAFRTGNDGDADSKLWSNWTRDARVENHTAVPLPAGPARFVQYRLTLHQGGSDPEPVRMDYSRLFFMGVNLPPTVIQLEVNEGGGSPSPSRGAAPPGGARGAGAGGAAGAFAGVLPGGAPGGAGPGSEGERAESGRNAHTNSMNFNVTWRVTDPNIDAMEYALYYKASDEKDWKLIQDKLTETRLPLDVSGIADGRYRVKLVVTDQPGNPPGAGLTAEKISDEFLVDNTPPRFEKLRATPDGKRATIEMTLVDDLSLISAAKMDIDNGDSAPVFPVDGLLDDQREDFKIQTPELKPGEHVATIEATDGEGNSATSKVIFTIK